MKLKKQTVLLSVATISMVGLSGCLQSDYVTDSSQLSTSQSSGTSQSPVTVGFSIVDSATGSTVYDSAISGSTAIRMVAGRSYAVKAEAMNAPAGSVVTLVATNTSAPAAAPIVLSAQSAAAFTPPALGDYQFKVQVSSPASAAPLVSRSYAASVACQSPTFTAASLNAAGISVTGSNNLYNYSAAGVVAGADGQAPYQCAFDLTGVGIADTAFAPCSQAQTSKYSAYVGARSIGVVVKDACNTAYTVSASRTLPAAVPASPGGVFIAGNISNESGPAASDPRIKGVAYLATNVGGNDIVQPSYDGSTFTIYSFQNYGQPSSVQFGMQLSVAGLGGNFDLTNNVNGTIDTSHASIQSVSFKTDQAGDQSPTVTLSSSSCTTTGIQARVLNPTGTPCGGGSSGGSNNTATVEVWGNYRCVNVSGSGSSVTISGTFDGYDHLVDSCSGGGGGGGGVAPIAL